MGIDMNKHPMATYQSIPLEFIQDTDDNVDDILNQCTKTERDTDELERRAKHL